MATTRRPGGGISRRGFVAGAAAALAGAATAPQAAAADMPDVPPEDYRIQNGRIKQSVMGWCYKPISNEDLIRACHKMGMPAVEGVSRDEYPLLRELGMKPAIVSGGHGFKKGPFNRENRDFCIEKLREGIDVAAEFDSPNVITFTGYREEGISDEEGMQNCVDCWKEVAGYAEQKEINLCLEHLNTRDDSHPMKGHPGYFGDDMDVCIELVKRVGSPRMKVLFDIYHVQVMNGDVIRRIRQYIDYIGHVHTAGVPGRGELDDTQELNYPPIMRALLEAGYTGYVGQESIPTWSDKLAALRHAVRLCDV